MRIIVNDIAASKGGAMNILKDFYETVKLQNDDNEWIFLLGDNYLEETENIKVLTFKKEKASQIKRLCFDLFYGRKIINKLNPDVVLSFQNTICFGVKCKQVVYVHQSLPFQDIKKFSFFKKGEKESAIKQRIVGKIIKKSIKKADKVFVQTQWMKEGVIKKTKISEDKISTILPNVKNIEKYNVDFSNKLFFYPTSNNIYKNISCIEKAVEVLNKDYPNLDVEITVDKRFNSPRIKGVGYIDKKMVERKYFERTLIFPSYIETFGYPLAEAKQAGTIILASDCSFSHEVLGDYKNAYYFNYSSYNELASLMKDVMEEKIVKKECSEIKEESVNSWIQLIEEVKSV